MRQIILASGSARRKDIMEFLGIPFEIAISDFPEENVHFEDFDEASDYVSTIAMGKALTIASQYEDLSHEATGSQNGRIGSLRETDVAKGDALILAADTSVFLDGNVYNKPMDLDDARRILQALRARRHEVITAIVLLDTLTNQKEIQSVSTFVEFLPFSDEQLENYIETSESLGKAGAYAIQLGAKSFVKSIEGSLSNVVGLPIEETAALLEQFDVPIEVDIDTLVAEHFTHS
jgi:septum formation protein